MGRNDSTKTRVMPVFSELLGRDPTGDTWLAELLELPDREGATGDRTVTPPLRAATMGFGPDEVSLAPPRALLRWMVENPSALSMPRAAVKHSETTRLKRKALLGGDSNVQAEALALLSNGAPSQVWYVLEGRSRPDVFVETEDTVIVIEGKRTEPGATTSTSWLPRRDQMLRHIDCAWEIRGHRRVFGFFIVEGKSGFGLVPKKWEQVCAETVSEEVLAASLPHRSKEARAEIAAAFLGATTWQEVTRQFAIKGTSTPAPKTTRAPSGTGSAAARKARRQMASRAISGPRPVTKYTRHQPRRSGPFGQGRRPRA